MDLFLIAASDLIYWIISTQLIHSDLTLDFRHPITSVKAAPSDYYNFTL